MRQLLCPNERNDESKGSHCILEVDPVKLALWPNNGGIGSTVWQTRPRNVEGESSEDASEFSATGLLSRPQFSEAQRNISWRMCWLTRMRPVICDI